MNVPIKIKIAVVAVVIVACGYAFGRQPAQVSPATTDVVTRVRNLNQTLEEMALQSEALIPDHPESADHLRGRAQALRAAQQIAIVFILDPQDRPAATIPNQERAESNL